MKEELKGLLIILLFIGVIAGLIILETIYNIVIFAFVAGIVFSFFVYLVFGFVIQIAKGRKDGSQ